MASFVGRCNDGASTSFSHGVTSSWRRKRSHSEMLGERSFLPYLDIPSYFAEEGSVEEQERKQQLKYAESLEEIPTYFTEEWSGESEEEEEWQKQLEPVYNIPTYFTEEGEEAECSTSLFSSEEGDPMSCTGIMDKWSSFEMDTATAALIKNALENVRRLEERKRVKEMEDQVEKIKKLELQLRYSKYMSVLVETEMKQGRRLLGKLKTARKCKK